MRIDSTHRSWSFAILAITALAAMIYISYANSSIGPRGGSALGLIFGIAGYALMIYAALLGLRKKFPAWRVGRASTWMRGHLWLGFLSFPLILFHAGFAAKGGLTAWLMTLMIIVITVGVIGAAVQHYLPKLMTRLVPLETIYEEIPRIQAQLQSEAAELVSPLWSNEFGGSADYRSKPGRGSRSSTFKRVAVIEIEPEMLNYFREVYNEIIHPFLSDPDRAKNECANNEQSSALFASLRTYLPQTVHHILADLESICEEERQLKRQKLIYRCLHGWLLIHVPLSLALILLGGIHAVVALWY